MGIAISALSAFQHVFTPLHQWLDWVLSTPRPTASRAGAGTAATVARTTAAYPAPSRAAQPGAVPRCNGVNRLAPRPIRRPLRVVRVLDAETGTGAGGSEAGCRAPTQAGARMVISGRMADVCAELDRLAAAEAAQTLRH